MRRRVGEASTKDGRVLKKARTESEGTEESGKPDSISSLAQGEHSQSPGSSDVAMTGALNQRLIVDMYEGVDDKGNRKIELAISDRRPPTHLGGDKQGDHVTAYIAYLHMLITAVDGESIQKAVSIITEAAKAILPNKVAIFNGLLGNLEPLISTIVSRDSRHAIIEALRTSAISSEEIGKMNEALKRDKRTTFMNVTKQICQKFLEEVNLDEEIAFARVGESVSGAGAKEKKAIHILKVINELESINPRATQREKEDQFDQLYTRCIKTSALYVVGINNVLDLGEVTKIREKWAYLKDWENVHSHDKGWEEQREGLLRKRFHKSFKELCGNKETFPVIKIRLLEELSECYNNTMSEVDISAYGYTTRARSSQILEPILSKKITLISKCFGDLFDFKYKNHQQELINDPELLYRVTARHLVCMFRAFSELQSFDISSKNQIISLFFTEALLKEQGWSEYRSVLKGRVLELDVTMIDESVKKYIDLDAHKMLPPHADAVDNIALTSHVLGRL